MQIVSSAPALSPCPHTPPPEQRMCTFEKIVTVCLCDNGMDCLVSRRRKLVVVNGFLHHVIGEPMQSSQLCARRKRMGKDAVPARDCLKTPPRSRFTSRGDKTVFVMTKEVCEECRLCEEASGWI